MLMLFSFGRIAMRLALVSALCLAGTVLASTAEAKTRTAWEGGFMGGKWVEDSGFFGGDMFAGGGGSGSSTRTEYHREHRIFSSSRACEAWLYQMRSSWQDMPRYSWCRKVRVAR